MLEEEYNPRRQLPPRLRPAPPPEPEFSFELRQATERDVPHMLEIYNHYVANSTVTFDEDALTLKEMRHKFRDVERLGFPWIVAESPSGMIFGYAYVTPWKAKAAYRYTVEDSIYLSPAATGKGWEAVTEHAIRALAARGGPLVAIRWGRDAGTLRPLLSGIPIIASAHPSPLSANAGFFGSRPFSRANELLVAAGAAPVDWSLGATPNALTGDT